MCVVCNVVGLYALYLWSETSSREILIEWLTKTQILEKNPLTSKEPWYEVKGTILYDRYKAYAASRTLGENGSAEASRADRTMPSNLRSSAVMLCS